jgi:hypothetical protein
MKYEHFKLAALLAVADDAILYSACRCFCHRIRYQAQGSAQDFMAEPGASMRFRQYHSVTRKGRQTLGVHAEISLYIDKMTGGKD